MGKLNKIMYVAMLIIAIIFTFSNIAKATTVEITTETLNLRKEASTDSDIVAQISVGEECEVLADEGDWYRVQYGDYTGYVSKEYTKVVGGEDTTGNGDNTSDNDVTSDEPEDTSTNDTTEEPQENTNTESQENTNQTDETEPETDLPSSSNNGVTTAKINSDTDVKIVPLINGSAIGNVKANTEVTVVTQTSGWAYIQTDTISGWIRADVLSSTSGESSNEGNENSDNNADNNTNADDTKEADNQPDESTSNFEERTMYTTDYVNIRKEPSTSSDRLMTVEQNTALKVVGETGDWYEVETSQGNAYVSKELLSDKEVSTTTRGGIDRVSNNETEDKNNEDEAGASDASTSNSSDSSAQADEIIAYAKKFLGVPYVYGGASPSGFDCSGFTMYVYNKFGISMRHGAQAQAKLGKTVNVDKSSKSSMLNNLKKGDLVFFLDYETMDEIGHCGIYIGDGDFIHASSGSGYCVKINSLLPGEYYNTRYCAARRIL